MKLFQYRTEKSDIPMEPPYLPKTLLELVAAFDPASQPYQSEDASNPFYGKKILVLSGREDPLVPWIASEPFISALKVGDSGIKEVNVYPGVGHKCTPQMVVDMGEFVAKHVLA